MRAKLHIRQLQAKSVYIKPQVTISGCNSVMAIKFSHYISVYTSLSV